MSGPIEGVDLGACPFCDGTIGATSPGSIEIGVFHSMPPCATFNAIESPIDFVIAVRIERARRSR